MRRICVIVADSMGIGYLPDADKYGDVGANTLGHICENYDLKIPVLESMGIGNIADLKGIKKVDKPIASFGKMSELSPGKDTITGHWEMMGTVLEHPFPVYERFPAVIIDEFEKRTGKKTIGNFAASGTEIIKDLGEEHLKTGALIVYTSADSVFQIAANEKIVTVPELYKICEIAREILTGEFSVGRVIARPFVGTNKDDFVRTANRKDFPVLPPENVLTILQKNNVETMAVGKIEDIFAGKGISKSSGHNKNNLHGLKNTLEFFKEKTPGFIFTNLVDFDMKYGHRNDFEGYAKAIEEMDTFLPKIIEEMDGDDILIITADHGCDPCFKGTDHTREYIPILVYSKEFSKCADLKVREGFIDISATILDYFGIKYSKGISLLKEI
ncbi:MAG: phosphopentomutase [Candidatus Muiribacterium halophilum]|uniref:Phosphopentomutase n=1 Tax=Muiribacterium halophilum TaxID=2053465 RepID=A0A2N5ZBP3_MUIH1|nr:MAG: phosphopentomutase [Candidatus Muirbacterium halophilum]